MEYAHKNKVFRALVSLHQENAQQVSAIIYKDGLQLAEKSLKHEEAGYLFSHVFTEVGLHKIKIIKSSGLLVWLQVSVSDIPDQVWRYKRG